MERRRTEIDDALNETATEGASPVGLPVIPVRMTEAWLLLDRCAIREAAGNPNGSTQLDLPSLGDIERIPNPKSILHEFILRATELPARRKKRFDVHGAVYRIPEYIEDFSPLCGLPAFERLEQQVLTTIEEQHWGD